MILPRLRAQDALEVEGTISGDRGSAALRQVQTGTACTNRRGSAVFVMPALLAGLFGYSVSIVSYHPSSVRLKREQVQLVGVHGILRGWVGSDKSLLQREFLEHGHRENL
jgi:hypothetical protein